MSGNDIDRTLADWFESDALAQAPADGVERALAGARRRSPRPGWLAGPGSHWVGDSVGPTSGAATLGRTGVRTSMALLLLLLVLALVAGAVLVGGRLLQPAPVDLGIFEPVAGRIVYGDEYGIWGVDPTAPADPATRVQLTSEAGIPLGWSSDGTELLIGRIEGASTDGAGLFVLHADGSETLVTADPMFRGSTITGATISPDGSRVVFVGGTGELLLVDADGGQAEVLAESQEGFLEDPTFSPDGTQIAYDDGAGDNNHHVWVMDADGSDAHEIVTKDCACHVNGLAWSPAGDRIALGIDDDIYTFAPDGSDLTRVTYQGKMPYWSPDGSQLAFDAQPGLAIADADGAIREFGTAMPGPWHPGTPSPLVSQR